MKKKRAILDRPVKLAEEQIDFLKARMMHLSERNPSWGISKTNYKLLYEYLAV